MSRFRPAGLAVLLLAVLPVTLIFQNCAEPPGAFTEVDFDDVENLAFDDERSGFPDIPRALKADAPAAAAAKKKNFLKTSGNQLIDAVTKKRVALSGVSWQGLETPNYAPVGLYARGWKSMLDEVKAKGFNTVRVPVSLAMFKSGAVPRDINFKLNPELKGKNPQQILDLIVAHCGKIGLRVVIVIHRITAGHGTEMSGLWYNKSSTEKQWIDRWKALAKRYKGNPTVIGADLFNEPHHPAKWGGGGANDWARAAEAAGNAIHSVNPDWLIIVEGVSGWKGLKGVPYDSVEGWWSQNLQGVAKRPIRLKVPNKVVYSPHVYPPEVLGQYPKELFGSAKFPANMAAVWTQTFGYIYIQKIAPIWIGEFAFNEKGKVDVPKCNFRDAKEPKWASAFLKYLAGDFNLDGKKDVPAGHYGMSWAYWDWGFDDCGRYLYDDVMFKKTSATKLKLLKPVQYPAP